MARAVEAIVSFADATDAMDEAAAAYLGLTRSEVRCLGALRRGPLSAGEIAHELNLTRGAITALVDRLEARGFVERQAVSDDRRRVNIAMMPAARSRIARIWGPLAGEGAQHVRQYSDEQLSTIAEFLATGRDLQLRHAARVRGMTPDAPEPGPRDPEEEPVSGESA